MTVTDTSRRRFLKILASATGGLVVAFDGTLAQNLDTPLPLLGMNITALGPYVRIETNGDIFIGVRAPDFGQGARTTLARIIADELDADWSRVTVLPLPLEVAVDAGHAVFPLAPQDARGSTTVRHAWRDLRQAAATARQLLLLAAQRQLRLPLASLHTHSSQVLSDDGRRLGYGQLVTAAAALKPPSPPPAPKNPDHYTLIGGIAGDVDARDIVQGQTRYTIDEHQGEMLVAVIVRCPYLDGRIVDIDDEAALKIDGVVKTLVLEPPDGDALLGTTPHGPGVAVLAENTWAALSASRELKVTWEQGSHADASSKVFESQALQRLDDDDNAQVLRVDGDVDTVARRAGNAPRRRIEVTYTSPFLAHVTMEPLSCLVEITNTRVRVRAPTQDPEAAFAVIQRLTGVAPTAIELSFPRMGGGYGRRLDSDHIAEAVRVAQSVQRPVKLMWTRGDDLRHDTYRPFAVQRLDATLDRAGRIVGWRHRIAATPRNARRGVPTERLWQGECFPDALPAGLVSDYAMLWHALEAPVPCGTTRAPGHDLTAFATECFLDEIAYLVKRDPLDFRLDLIGEPRTLPYRGDGGPALDTGRLAAVLRAVAERIDWKRPRRGGQGLGIACHYSFGSYAAHAFEVSFEKGELRFHRVVCALDVGRVVNPLGVAEQAESATLDGIASAMSGAITFNEGAVVQQSLRDYRVLRGANLPRRVETILMPSSATPSSAGETGLPSAAPALANAIHAASTVRIHRLPILPELNRLL